MDAKFRPYYVEDSDARIKEILDGGAAFDESEIPNSASLTYTNGFYVECTAIFIDIRGSSKLVERYAQRRTLGKLYRAYVSECVAVLNGSPHCSQVFIQGDSVSAVFDTPNRQAVNDVFRLVASLNSAVHLLNFRLEQRELAPIAVGIGIDTGRALMLKAGFSGSGISDIIWMGDVLNRASHLCHSANKDGRNVIQVSDAVQALVDQEAMSFDGKKFIARRWGLFEADGWECDVVNVEMDRHLSELVRQKRASESLFAPTGLLGGLAALLASAPPPAPESTTLGGLFSPDRSPSSLDPMDVLIARLKRRQ